MLYFRPNNCAQFRVGISDHVRAKIIFLCLAVANVVDFDACKNLLDVLFDTKFTSNLFAHDATDCNKSTILPGKTRKI